MKTTLFLFALLTFSIAVNGNTGTENLFTNTTNTAQLFEELNALEQYLNTFQNTSVPTLSQLPTALSTVSTSNPETWQGTYQPHTDDISPFLIGCCLGPIGIGMLAASENSEDAIKAFFGCLIPTALFGVGLYTGDPMFIWAAFEIFLEVWE